MRLLWPLSLFLLVFIPISIAVYIWILKRRKRFSIQYTSLSLIRDAIPKRTHWRRHLPFVLFLLATASLITAMARPTASVRIPSNQVNIILALDVSLSMCSSDIPPTRLTIAQEAAENFILNKEPGTKIGIVAFAGFAELVLPPTDDKEALLAAVNNLTAARWTAIGSAILRSIAAIAEVNQAVPALDVYMFPELTLPDANQAPIPTQPDIIVLLTDGSSNRGAPPLIAAQMALNRGVRVYTIGFGTPQGSSFNCTAKQLGGLEFGGFGGGGFGGGGFGGGFGSGNRGFRLGIDEETLQLVAEMTDAEYHLAESADELLEVFANIPTYLVINKVDMEVSAFFTAAGALLLLAAAALSMRWNPLLS